MVHATDIVELELNSKKFKLSVKKREALEAAEPTIIHMPAPAAAYAPAPVAAAPAPAPAPAPAAPAAAAAPAAPAPAPAAPAAPAAIDGLEVVSPMAGTMYRSPAPGEPAFVKVCGGECGGGLQVELGGITAHLVRLCMEGSAAAQEAAQEAACVACLGCACHQSCAGLFGTASTARATATPL